jgi:hypothetical protein
MTFPASSLVQSLWSAGSRFQVHVNKGLGFRVLPGAGPDWGMTLELNGERPVLGRVDQIFLRSMVSRRGGHPL